MSYYGSEKYKYFPKEYNMKQSSMIQYGIILAWNRSSVKQKLFFISAINSRNDLRSRFQVISPDSCACQFYVWNQVSVHANGQITRGEGRWMQFKNGSHKLSFQCWKAQRYTANLAISIRNLHSALRVKLNSCWSHAHHVKRCIQVWHVHQSPWVKVLL